MTRGEASQIKVHYKGEEDDFVVFIDDAMSHEKYKTDKSVPMAQFISTFQVFVTHKQGAQGMLDTASKSTLENEFGTSKEEEVIKIILEKGSLQNVEMPGRQGPKNDSMSSMKSH